MKKRCAVTGRKYKVVGGLSFYNRAEVKDSLAYLKLLLNPKDNVGLLRVLNVPARGIGKTTVEQIEKLAREKGRQPVGRHRRGL